MYEKASAKGCPSDSGQRHARNLQCLHQAEDNRYILKVQYPPYPSGEEAPVLQHAHFVPDGRPMSMACGCLSSGQRFTLSCAITVMLKRSMNRRGYSFLIALTFGAKIGYYLLLSKFFDTNYRSWRNFVTEVGRFLLPELATFCYMSLLRMQTRPHFEDCWEMFQRYLTCVLQYCQILD